MKRTLLIALAFAIIGCGYRIAYSQWKLVASYSGSSVSSIYFQDAEGKPNVGFTGYTKGGIIKTADRGRTWAPVYINTRVIAGTLDFTFKDSLIGWAAVGAGIVSTTDGGNTWNQTSFTAECHCVYYQRAKKLLFANSPLTNSKVSTDDGLTWNDYGPRRLLGMAFDNDTVGIETSFDNNYRYTTDGGVNWSTSGFLAECWQPMGIKGTTIFFAGSETFIGTDQLYRSIDGGVTWKSFYSFFGKSRITGSIRGDAKHLYIQSDAGVYVSNDTGNTWRFICGPSNDWDTRFYASGDTVFAGDRNGGIWMSPTAGKGPYSEKIVFSESPLRFFNNECAKTKTSLYLNDPSNCEAFRVEILEAKISGSKNFILNPGDTFPRMLAKTEAINVTYLPNPSLYDTGFLYLKYQRNGKSYDTTILLIGEHVNSYGVIVNPAAIKTLIQSPCQIIDTNITIKNLPCDTVSVTGASFINQGFFSVISPGFPIVLPPDSSVTIHITGQSTKKGLFSDTISLYMRYSNSSFTSTIPITTTVYKDVEARPQIGPSSLNFGLVSVCYPSTKQLFLRNTVCQEYRITAIRLVNSNKEFAITKSPNLPLTLSQDQRDSVEVTFAPQLSGSYSGRITVTILFQGKFHDTTIIMGGMGTTGIAANFADSILAFDSLYSCESRILETSILNTACTPCKLVRLQNTNALGFIVTEPQLPVWIGPGEKKKIAVKFNSNRIGDAQDILYAFLESQGGGTQDFPIPLSGFIRSDTQPIIISIADIAMDTISVCSSSDTMLTLGNFQHCDSMRIDSVWLNGDPEFSLTVSGPNILLPNDSRMIRIHFAPQFAGIRQTIINIRYTNGSNALDTSIRVTATSTGVARILGASLTSCDFGSTTICDEKDTMITLWNSGCDSLVITNGEISGIGFEISGLGFPLVLAPGESRKLRILTRIDTAGAKSLNSAYLVLEANADSVLPAIPLSRGILYPHSVEVKIAEDKYTGDSIVSYSIFADNLTGVKTIDFDLSYNMDLLNYHNSSATSTISSSDGRHFEMRGDPLIRMGADGSVGKLLFGVFLAKDSTTSLNLSNPHLNFEDPKFEQCIATAFPGDIASFRYIFGCAERMYFDYLHHKQILHLNSLKPNPAQDEIVIDAESAMKQEARIEIRDALGAEVYSSAKQLIAGSNTIRLDMKGFSAGMYLLRIYSGNGSESGSFVKVK